MELALRIKLALQLLMQAHEYSLEVGSERWDFAVECSSLQELGLTKNDLRWLIYKNYVVHAHEVTGAQDDRRNFQPCGKAQLGERSSFILTQLGATVARSLLCGDAEPYRPRAKNQEAGNGKAKHTPAHFQMAPALGAGTPSNDYAIERPARPSWDKDRRMLRFGVHVVKQFKVPAPNQEIILESFEEENWPIRIDDPLPLHAAIDPKRRLHDTINSLNRNQRANLLRFTGDGSGEAICWDQLIAASATFV